MEKIITCLFLVLGMKISAQITITSSNMPSIKDTFRFTIAPNGSFDFKKTGANYSWDYSQLGISSQDVDKFEALLTTPYSTLAFAGMPAGAIGVKQADSVGSGQAGIKNIYNFYDKKSTGWSTVGTGFTLSALPIPAGGVYSDKDEIYTFPLNYNDQDTTSFAVNTKIGNILFSLGYYKQNGYRINKVEGWGTITTPYGNSISCLKVKSIVSEIDSLVIPTASLNVGFPNNRVEYKWLSTTEKIPVLEVAGTEIAGVFTPTTIKYRDKYRVVPPSPLTPKIKFTANKYSGNVLVDTFSLINKSTPQFGNTYLWTILPATGVRFVKGTNKNSTNPFIVFDNGGNYNVNLSATNFMGTKDSTAINMIIINGGTQIQSIQNEDFSFYPNPVIDQLKLKNPSFENATCRIFDLTGRLVLEQIINDELSVDCRALARGIYHMVITGKEIITLPLVKE